MIIRHESMSYFSFSSSSLLFFEGFSYLPHHELPDSCPFLSYRLSILILEEIKRRLPQGFAFCEDDKEEIASWPCHSQ